MIRSEIVCDKRKMDINVVCSLRFKSSVFHLIERLFIILLSLSACQRCTVVEECDFIKCAASVKSFVRDLRTGTPFQCRNVLNSPWCSAHCLHRYFPNIPPHSSINQYNFGQYCNESISNRNANWTCVAHHSFQLLTCLANVNSLTTNTVREDMLVTESCRKSHEFQNCATEVLQPNCGETSAEVVKDVLQFFSKNFMPSCKGTNLKEILSVPVYYQLGEEYMGAAKSMDVYYNYLSDCFDQLQDKYDLNGFLCGEFDPLTGCINYTLTRRAIGFPALRRLLLKYFLLGDFKCKQPATELKYITSEGLQSSTEMKSPPDYEIDQHSHVLNEESEHFSDFTEMSSSTSSYAKSDDAFEHKVPAEIFTSSPVKNLTEIVDQKITVNDFSGGEVNDSYEKTSSENTVGHMNINYMTASTAFSLNYDRTLIIFLFLFVIL